MPRILADLAGTNQTTFRIGQGPARVTVDASACTVPRTLLAPDADGTIATQAYAAAQAAAAQAYAIQRANHTGTQLAATISDFAAAALAATAAAYDVAGAAAAAQAYAIQRANHTGTQAAATISDFAAAALAATASAYQPVSVNLTALASDYDGATKTLTHNVSKAATSAGLALQANNGTLVVTLGPGGGAGAAFADGVTCASLTATGANGVATVQAATQDGVRLLGRAGGVSSYVGTLTVAALGASRTYTLPDASVTVAGSAAALTPGRVPYATTGGLLTDAAGLLFETTGGGRLTVGTGLVADPNLRINGVAGTPGSIYFQAAGVLRWLYEVAGTESGSDSGSSFRIRARTDAGAAIDTPIDIVRAAGGAITLARPVTCTGAVTVPNGTAAAPGLRTSENHGLYRIAADTLGVSVAGVRQLQVYATDASTRGVTLYLDHGAAGLIAGFVGSRSDAVSAFSGGSGLANSGQVRCYGSTHATKADYVEFTRGATVSARFDGSGNLTCNGALSATGLRATTGFHEGPINGGITFNAYYSAGWKYRSNGYASALTDNAASGVILQVAPTGLADAAISWQALFTGTPTTLGFASAIVSTFNNTTDATTTSDGSVRLAGGLSVLKAGVFGGAVTVPNGTAAAPGLRLTSEAHGLYRGGAAALGLAVAGSAALTVSTSTGAVYRTSFTISTSDDVQPAWLYADSSAQQVMIGGSSAGVSSHGQIRVYGSTHASKAGYVEFTRGATVSAYFNGSGKLTINGTTDGILTVGGKIAAKVAVPGSFADLAAVQAYLASILT